MPASIANGPGVFITFEGGEGAGKTTHIRFLAYALESRGHEVVCLREPGGTRIGEALRSVVLDAANGDLSDAAELLIYEASRAQLVAQVIAPALDRGAVVLCDRFFDSSTAYQGYGRGLPLDFIDRANLFACQGRVPCRTVLMKASPSAEVGLERATVHLPADRMESAGLDFHARVNAAFDRIAAGDPDRVRVVYSGGAKPETARQVFAAVADLFSWDGENMPFDDGFFEGVMDFHGKSGGPGKRS